MHLNLGATSASSVDTHPADWSVNLYNPVGQLILYSEFLCAFMKERERKGESVCSVALENLD